jgi:hypothetical protein
MTAAILMAFGLLLLVAPAATPSGTFHARGAFDVTLTPQGEQDKSDGATTGRMTIAKQYHGDLEGTGKGEMLSALADVKGSGSYVAIERVSGTLNGRHGTFILAHGGTMTRGAQQLDITVVPDSGTGDLAGITGRMTITITEGKHQYDFEYTIHEEPHRQS